MSCFRGARPVKPFLLPPVWVEYEDRARPSLRRLDWMTLERTLGFVGAVITLERLFIAEERTEKAWPPPRDKIALAWSIKLKSSLSFCLSRKRILFWSSFAKSIDSSITLNASSLFLNKYIVPKPFILMRASLFVLRLTSTRATKKSVKNLLTCSLVELVIRDRDAKES